MKLLLENWRKYLTEEEEVSDSEIIGQAWENTSEGHLRKAFSQRAPGGAGSTFDSGATLESLKNAGWGQHPDPNGYIREPARGFVTNDLGGVLGVLPVGSLPEQQQVRFQPAHMGQVKSDTGETAYEAVSVFKGGRPQVDSTTLLIGPQWFTGHAKDPEKPVIWTFYPGDPTPPPSGPRFIVEKDIISKVPNAQQVESGFKNEDGTPMNAYVATIADAMALGFGNIKYVEN
jgi:hypothetical protein